MTTRPTRSARGEMLCEVIRAPIKSPGRGSFAARVSRMLSLGYVPLGNPHWEGDMVAIVLVKMPNGLL